MDNVYEITLLLDFYGHMLTCRQFDILDLHYNNDYSLGEIAEQLGISRQGVYDNIKRGKTILYEMEQKLGLVGKFSNQKEKGEELLTLIDKIDVTGLDTEGKEYLERVRSGILSMINSF